MSEKGKIKQLERKIDRLEENSEQEKLLRNALFRSLMLILKARFVNRGKILKMYKTNEFDLTKTVELYFDRKKSPSVAKSQTKYNS